MPIECRLSPVPVTVNRSQDEIVVEWEWFGDIFQRRYLVYGKDDRERNAVRDAVQVKARDFVNRLKELHQVDIGPAVFKLTPDEVQERHRRSALRAELLASYVECLADGTDATLYAEQLGIPADRVDADARLVARYRKLREQFDSVPEKQRALSDFHAAYADRRSDWFTSGSLGDQHRRLKLDLENAQASIRGLHALRRERPELFVNDPQGGGIRLVAEALDRAPA